MGVPSFYRWLTAKYPKIVKNVVEPEDKAENSPSSPVYDNLYLDMNGIIHNASHPDKDGVSFDLSEEEMKERVFAIICRLVEISQPQKLLFMALDGVAPRAKMNQQRSRRFLSGQRRSESIEVWSFLYIRSFMNGQ